MTSSPSPPRRILMVNYHTDTNRIMTRLLQRYGYEATAAETLAAASQLLDDIEFDVLLCRNTAADGEPADFIRETKSRFPTIPIIAFGGGLNEQRIQELQQAGANECLYLPFDMNQLLQLLGPLLEPPMNTDERR
jgi:DNA-binding NtrC family response regulator